MAVLRLAGARSSRPLASASPTGAGAGGPRGAQRSAKRALSHRHSIIDLTTTSCFTPPLGSVQKYGRFPTAAEIRFECHADPALPSHNTFRRFGGLGGLRTRLGTFAAEQGLSDVVAALPDHAAEPIADSPAQADSGTRALVDGFVYLIKSGRHFKSGKANSVEARHRQLKIQLPQAAEVVHRIKTDDPLGIEAYLARPVCRQAAEW